MRKEDEDGKCQKKSEERRKSGKENWREAEREIGERESASFHSTT